MEKFTEPRRKDRILPLEEAQDLLHTALYGYLSLGPNPAGYAYGIPLSYVYDGECVWFHCAPEGEKLECLKNNSKVTFCVVDGVETVPGAFTTRYRSAIAFGVVHPVFDDAEKLAALDLLVKKYDPEHAETGRTAAQKSLHRTAILRLQVEHITGKQKR